MAVHFHLDHGSGLPPYLQVVRQVRHALRLGHLGAGDRLPTVKDLAGHLAVNQNTVLKAYRELDHDGLITSQPGVGTFIRITLTGPAHGPLLDDLRRWLTRAREAGLDDELIEALVATALHPTNLPTP